MTGVQSKANDNHQLLTINWERGLHYFIVAQRVTQAGQAHVLPVLYVVAAGEDSRVTVTRSHALLAYCLKNAARSHTWMLNTVRTVGALIDFTMAMHPFLRRAQSTGSVENAHDEMLQRFAKAFLGGTSLVDKGVRREMYSLFWQPRSAENARICLAALTTFLTSVSNSSDEWSHAASPSYIDPLSAVRLAYQSLARRSNNLLSHLDYNAEPAPPHVFGGLFGSRKAGSRTYAFPVRYVWPLLFRGFERKRLRDVDETAKTIAFLLFAGGGRQSEPFHLWVQDVQFVDDDVYVFVHHPEEGDVVSASGEILQRKVALQLKGEGPRNRLGGKRRHSGFKGLDEEKDGALLHWLPVPQMTEILATLLSNYITIVRPRIMRLRRARGLPDHPFLFVSSGETRANGRSDIGAPYTLSAFKSAWKRAVGRISTLYNDPTLVVRKHLGTSIHGTRHFYGRFLQSIGCDAETIRRCMHHKDIRSQIRYKKLTAQEINQLLNEKANSKSRKQMLSDFLEGLSQKEVRYGCR
ncbi:site-specific integrase [Rhizobium leguminosarum]|uniref:hypothetical protein n=1 Tax=Rhizobium leguminosarum TaxID=384 RepID=UPI001C97C0DC|nr:hypothetical protein [Rhizobium leguminosarum]MBY5635907.1 site-specific integrase [Rhizobium leguminosarum]